jgi:hypothetical protein
MTDRRASFGSPAVIAGLLVAATVFFVWGALAERSDHHDSPTATKTHQEEGSGETPAEHSAEGGASESSSEYQPLGIDLESDALIVVAALVSLALAGLVAFRPSRPVFAGVVVLGVVFTAFEIAEVVHQADVDEAGLVALAALAAVFHASAALLAAHGLWASRRTPSLA